MVVDCQIQSNLSFFGTLGVLLILMRTENTFSKQTLSCKIKVSLDVPSRDFILARWASECSTKRTGVPNQGSREYRCVSQKRGYLNCVITVNTWIWRSRYIFTECYEQTLTSCTTANCKIFVSWDHACYKESLSKIPFSVWHTIIITWGPHGGSCQWPSLFQIELVYSIVWSLEKLKMKHHACG